MFPAFERGSPRYHRHSFPGQDFHLQPQSEPLLANFLKLSITNSGKHDLSRLEKYIRESCFSKADASDHFSICESKGC